MYGIFEHYEKGSRKRAFVGVMALILGFFALAFVMDFGQRIYVYSQARGKLMLFQPVRDGLLNAYFSIPFKERKQALLKTNLPIYELKISEKRFNQLEYMRKKVAAAGYSTGINRSYVDAEFKIDGRWVDAKVKLRGLTYFHYTKTRPSIRVKFKGQYSIDGIDEVNFVDPYDKGITADNVAFEYLHRHGLLTVPNRFVILKINDEVAGLYQQFTQFGHVLLDNRSRASGHIFDGQGQTFDQKDAAYKRALPIVTKFQQCLKNSKCEPGFVDQYIDVPKFARAMAMSTLLGSTHAWASENVRVYFDPAHGRIEPVPWDFFFYKLDNVSASLDEIYKDTYALALLKDSRIRALHDTYLWDLINHSDELVRDSQKQFDRILTALDLDVRHYDLYRDLKMHHAFHNALKQNSQVIKQQYFTAPPAEARYATLMQTSAPFDPRLANVIVEGHVVRFKQRVNLQKTLVVPFGYSVVFQPGLQLRLADSQGLIIYGSLKAMGTASQPISIAGLNSPKWAGIAVQGAEAAPAQVDIAYVNVSGGLGLATEGVQYAGAFSVHDAQVKIENSNFTSPLAGAAVSAKYSDLQIAKVKIADTPDDGLDVDFSKVKIEKMVFSRAGGDCADFNSSEVVISDSQISNCRDKGVSVGENSTAHAQNLKIDRALIGMAIKDRSKADLKNITIENAEVGVTSYFHKRTFGPSQVTLSDVKFISVKSKTVSSQGSEITIIHPEQN